MSNVSGQWRLMQRRAANGGQDPQQQYAERSSERPVWCLTELAKSHGIKLRIAAKRLLRPSHRRFFAVRKPANGPARANWPTLHVTVRTTVKIITDQHLYRMRSREALDSSIYLLHRVRAGRHYYGMNLAQGNHGVNDGSGLRSNQAESGWCA